MPNIADDDRIRHSVSDAVPFVAFHDPSLHLMDCVPQIIWSASADGGRDYFNAQWYAFTGAEVGSTNGMAWATILHPDDRPMMLEKWQNCVATGTPLETEYRLRHHSGSFRWTLARALPIRDDAGHIVRWIGTSTDIEDKKRLEQEHELLAGELKHRIENIFTVVGSLLALSARGRPEAREFADDMAARLGALRAAQDMLRLPGPLAKAKAASDQPAYLHQLLHRIFAPHPALQEGRILVQGDDVPIGEVALTPLALLFHELTTNALKYGALLDDGCVLVQSRMENGQLKLTWTETGGPTLSGPPETTGFGTDLATLSVRRQLGGELQRFWKPEGLELQAIVPLERLGSADRAP